LLFSAPATSLSVQPNFRGVDRRHVAPVSIVVMTQAAPARPTCLFPGAEGLQRVAYHLKNLHMFSPWLSAAETKMAW
jgi:hypothetical protein